MRSRRPQLRSETRTPHVLVVAVAMSKRQSTALACEPHCVRRTCPRATNSRGNSGRASADRGPLCCASDTTRQGRDGRGHQRGATDRTVFPLLRVARRLVLLLVCATALLCGSLAVSASQHSHRHSHSHAAAPTRARGEVNWGNPVPDASAVVVAPAGRAQFTVLTPSIIRMQYNEAGDFSDQDVQTYVVLNRNLPVPTFSSSVDGEGALTITTESLTLRYDSSIAGSFSAANLQVVVNNADGLGNNYTWNAGQGQDQIGNLKGTVRTLDGSNGTNTPLDCDLNMDGFSHCSWGVIGAKGFAVIDDTGAPAFDAPSPDTDWPWLRSRPNEPVDESLCTSDLSLRRQCGFNGIMWDECGRRGCCYSNTTADEGAPFCWYSTQASLDLYFFGHGLNFKQALLEFTQIAGKIPVPPRYLFGVYFSRYWAYADWEEFQLVQAYVDHQLPLDILVTDMDWSVFLSHTATPADTHTHTAPEREREGACDADVSH